jgi:hypothetical protein
MNPGNVKLGIEANQAASNWTNRLLGRVLSFPALIGVILASKAYWTCRKNIVDTDLGYRLLNGQYIVTHFHLPTTETYSYTAAGTPWLDHAWLPEALYFLAHRAFGWQGVFAVLAACAMTVYVGIFLLCRKETEDPLAAGLTAIFGGLLATVTFTPRTQNFGWLCFLAVFAILFRYRATRRGPLWLIPLIFCLWINCHGMWSFGLIVFALILGAGFISRDLGRLQAAPWTPAEGKKLLAVFAASVAALFVNPFGYHLVLLPFQVAMGQDIEGVALGGEWAAVDFNGPMGMIVLAVLAGVFLLALFQRRRWRIDEAALTMFVLYMGLSHIRFLVLAGIVLPPILAPQLGKISSYDPAHERRALNACLLAVALAVVALGFPSERFLKSQIEDFFPAGAVAYLQAHPQSGNIFNLYEWGGYIEWTLPEVRTFIDTRTDVFVTKGVFSDYVSIITLKQSEELLDRYQVSYLIYPASTPLCYFLSKNPAWERIYLDKKAAIYRRTGR